jgi:hypothetical protein
LELHCKWIGFYLKNLINLSFSLSGLYLFNKDKELQSEKLFAVIVELFYDPIIRSFFFRTGFSGVF